MTDKFVMSVRQAAELDHAFERSGWTPAEVKLLSSGSTLADVRKVLLGHASIAVVEHVIDCDAWPKEPSGLKVHHHQRGYQFKWDPAQVTLWLSKGQQNGKLLEGNKIHKELEGKPVFNGNVLDYLLAHPHLIPEEWKGKYVSFWGTIYRNSGGRLCVRYLYWRGDGWDWRCSWLDFDWGGRNPAALRAS